VLSRECKTDGPGRNYLWDVTSTYGENKKITAETKASAVTKTKQVNTTATSTGKTNKIQQQQPQQ
jgi:hypothetical protein